MRYNAQYGIIILLIFDITGMMIRVRGESMGGRGSSSGIVSSQKAKNKLMHDNMPARTKNSKSGKFNEFRYGGLDWWKESLSKSSGYLHMNRVSEDGDKIVVRVSDEHVKSTRYGNIQLQLDSQHVVYLKQWQVESHTEPYKGASGFEVVLDRKYFNPKQTKVTNQSFSNNKAALSFDHWKSVALKQEKSGNSVSIRV